MMAGKCIRLSKKNLALVLALLVVAVIYNKGIAKRVNWRYIIQRPLNPTQQVNKVVEDSKISGNIPATKEYVSPTSDATITTDTARGAVSSKAVIDSVKSVYISKGRGIAVKTDDSNVSSKASSKVGGSSISLKSQEDTILEHWVPDWYNNSNSAEDMEAMLMKRKNSIKKRCEEFSGYRPSKLYKPKILVSKTLRYCATFKAGFTFWKIFFINQEKNDTTVSVKVPSKPVSFTVTRNPWHRLVSCWHDRFTLDEPLRSKFMRQFCKGKTWPKLPPFSEFVRECVVTQSKRPNSHWIPTIDRCQLCEGKLKFDYILSQENMNTEAAHILTNHAGFDDQVDDYLGMLHEKSLRPGEKERFSSSYQEHYKNVSEQDMEILRKIYKYEIILFDYPRSPFVDFPYA